MTNEYEMVAGIFHGQEGIFHFFVLFSSIFLERVLRFRYFSAIIEHGFLRRLRRVIWRD